MLGHGQIITAWPINDVDGNVLATLTLYADATVTLGSDILPEAVIDPAPIVQTVIDAEQYIGAVSLLQAQINP